LSDTKQWRAALFGGFSKVSGGSRPVTESDLSSHEVTAPYRVFSLEKLAPTLLRRSPHAVRPFRLGYRVFTFQAPEEPLID